MTQQLVSSEVAQKPDCFLRVTDAVVMYLPCKGKIKAYLEAPSQELVLHLQKVAFIHLRLEGLVDDGKLGVVLDVLPAGVAVAAKPVKDRETLVQGRHRSFCSCYRAAASGRTGNERESASRLTALNVRGRS